MTITLLQAVLKTAIGLNILQKFYNILQHLKFDFSWSWVVKWGPRK